MRSITKNEAIAVAVALAVIILFFGAQFMSRQEANTIIKQTTDMPPQPKFEVKDVVVGTGITAQMGDLISVKYTGKFADGTVFDSTEKNGGKPIQFVLGQGRVIKGWDMGFDGMKVGGKRSLTIPSDLAYGPQGYGPIPGNTPLYFDVELVGVTRK